MRARGSRASKQALAELEALPRSTRSPQDDLATLAVDLRNATLDDPIADRAASRELDDRWGLDPRLEARLDRLIRNDPLELAGRRRFDTWHRLWARTFNAVVEPIGSSAITGFVLAPYQLANSLIHYFAAFSNTSRSRRRIARRSRCARSSWPTPRFAETPRSPEDRSSATSRSSRSTLAKRAECAAEKALDAKARLALHHAEHAVTMLEAHPEENGRLRRSVRALVEEAQDGLEAETALRLGSLEARPTPAATGKAEYATAAEILLLDRLPLEIELTRFPEPRADDEDRESYGASSTSARSPSIEDGFEAAARERLDPIGRAMASRRTMARHARVAARRRLAESLRRLRAAQAQGTARRARLATRRRMGQSSSLSEHLDAGRLSDRRAHDRDHDRSWRRCAR